MEGLLNRLATIKEDLETDAARKEEALQRMAVSPPTLISNLTTDPNFYVFLGPVVYLLFFIII